MSNTEALRAAAKAALECLENLQGGCTDSGDGTVEAITVWCPEVIDALRAALAQPAASGEPVAWFCEWFGPAGDPQWDQYHDRTDPVPDTWDEPPTRITPLYAAPHPAPALVPLTDDEAHAAYRNGYPGTSAPWGGFLAGVRFAEAAHGIAAPDAPQSHPQR